MRDGVSRRNGQLINRGTQCPLWVKTGHTQCKRACPLYPRKRTCAVQLEMSAKCQYRTNAVQQKGSLDHLVGPQQKRRRNGYPQRVSSSHVDHRFEFRRPYDRQFTRIGPSRDLTSKDTYQPIQAE